MDDAKPQKHFGLMANDLGNFRKRPAFYAIRNVLALFKDSGAPPAGELSYSFGAAPPSIKRHNFKRSDGSFLLVLYNDVKSYDQSRLMDIDPAPVNVTLTLENPANIEVFEPTFSAIAQQSVAATNSLVVPVADHVVVIRITMR